LRLDEVVSKKFNLSRNKAKELIKSKKVKVNEKVVTKPSFKVKDEEVLLLEDKVYVSRAALKLKNYLQKYNISLKDKLLLDIGSSTGGFSEVALEEGARVVAVDVGSEQMHKKLRDKVELFENTDIRDFSYPKKFDVIVSDVSFISLLKILKKIDSLIERGDIILLFKPQFEVGKEAKRDKRGVVVDKEAIKRARENFEKEAKNLGWRLIRSEEASVKGKEGNLEYIYHFVKEKND
jgi:23S rRNA (cytidine1920-2'-O)/16S rRNA (cytidine1409-2'-O)-methyltransferase